MAESGPVASAHAFTSCGQEMTVRPAWAATRMALRSSVATGQPRDSASARHMASPSERKFAGVVDEAALLSEVVGLTRCQQARREVRGQVGRDGEDRPRLRRVVLPQVANFGPDCSGKVPGVAGGPQDRLGVPGDEHVDQAAGVDHGRGEGASC